MKIEDIDTVSKLNDVLGKIDIAINKCDLFVDTDSKSHGIPGVTDFGFWCHISQDDDGSGDRIPLKGCYVGNEVANAVRDVLVKKRSDIITHLNRLGVDTSGIEGD